MSGFRLISWNNLHSEEKNFFAGGTALTVGGFDGLHLGHRALLNNVLEYAEKNFLKPGVITFSKPPAAEKADSGYAGEVSSLRLKLKEVEESGFEFAVLIDFSSNFAKISGRDFIGILLSEMNMKYLAVGEDFRCGYKRALNAQEIGKLAEENSFGFKAIPPVLLENSLRISSTAIRNAVFAGDFCLAEKLLGSPFVLDAKEINFEKSGGAVLKASFENSSQVLPEAGKYSVLVILKDGVKFNAELVLDGSGEKKTAGHACFYLDESAAPYSGKKNINDITDDFEKIQFLIRSK